MKHPLIAKPISPALPSPSRKTPSRSRTILIGPRHELSLPVTRVTLTLAGLAVLLVLASIASQMVRFGLKPERFHGLIHLFYVDVENNLPTFFSSALLLISALLVLAIAVLKRAQQAPFAGHWAVLSGAFLFLAIDEAASLHELLVGPLRALLGEHARGALHFSWVVVGLLAAVLFAGLFLRFFRHLPWRTRLRVALAAGLFLAGALGVEMIGGSYLARHGKPDFTYTMIATLEESLELAGSILFIHTWLTYLADHFGAVRVSLAR